MTPLTRAAGPPRLAPTIWPESLVALAPLRVSGSERRR